MDSWWNDWISGQTVAQQQHSTEQKGTKTQEQGQRVDGCGRVIDRSTLSRW